MPEQSAGFLAYRLRNSAPEFLLAHPGGPFRARKDLGAWSIPKGLLDPDELLEAATRREFTEETGFAAPADLHLLAPIKQKNGKLVHCWLGLGDYDLADFLSNAFELEWPRGSGAMRSFPEVDRVAYLGMAEALTKILPAQQPLLAEATAWLDRTAER